jgi:hypothetical protein
MASVEQRPGKDTSRTETGFYCSTSGTYFSDKESLAEHYKRCVFDSVLLCSCVLPSCPGHIITSCCCCPCSCMCCPLRNSVVLD